MKKTLKYLLFTMACLQFSCKDFLAIDPPSSSLVTETVFENNDQATAALTGIYATMTSSSNFASGGTNSVSCLAGLSADELKGYSLVNIPFFDNQLSPDNSAVTFLYTDLYKAIYTANSILEGLEASKGITPPVKAQLKGEALFIRGFAYFYLVNLYGGVPIQLSTDYRVTQVASRAAENVVYQQIIRDLLAAETLLPEAYPSSGRARPNKSAVQAMLARTYLYQKDWPNAEKYARLVLDKTATYKLSPLASVFLSTSEEAIWQLMPAAGSNTQDGTLQILTTAPTQVSLNEHFAQTAFEAADKRKTEWVKSLSTSSGTYYYPNKYRIKSSTTVTEFSMILRLGEVFLIRAEALAQQNKLDQAITDLDAIRDRAGLPLIKNTQPNMSQTDLLNAIQKERQVELFTEWGHRWLDLKRTGNTSQTLSGIKPNWQQTDQLYPIPYTETSKNLNISQNDGYSK